MITQVTAEENQVCSSKTDPLYRIAVVMGKKMSTGESMMALSVPQEQLSRASAT